MASDAGALDGMEQAFRLVRNADRLAIVYPLWADGPPAPASVRFAAAFALAKKGDVQAALNLYRELESGNDAQIRADAKFNSANLYFEQSLALRVSADPSRALTLVELAKQSYRELLRDHSDDWDARYNLERALRVAPDPEQDTQGLPPPPGARRTPTTVRAESLGLP